MPFPVYLGGHLPGSLALVRSAVTDAIRREACRIELTALTNDYPTIQHPESSTGLGSVGK